MNPLSSENIESELSYAYLHAVASHAGMSCVSATRHEDNNGIDATLTAWGPFKGGGYLTEVSMKIQLKATVTEPYDDGENLSYFLNGVNRYNDLRSETLSTARLLVVLFLPSDVSQWLEHSDEQLSLRKCAYWVSLRGAPETNNESGATVKIPKKQVFNAETLTGLAVQLSNPKTIPTYCAP